MQHAGKRRRVGVNGTCRAPRCTGWGKSGKLQASSSKENCKTGKGAVGVVVWQRCRRRCRSRCRSLPASDPSLGEGKGRYETRGASFEPPKPSTGGVCLSQLATRNSLLRLRGGTPAPTKPGREPEIIKSGKTATGFWHVGCCVKPVAALSVSRLMNSRAVVARLTPFNARALTVGGESH